MAATKNLLIGASALAGAAAALVGGNTAIAAAASPLWPVLPGEEKRYSWRDGEIGYAVRGDGPPMLLLHGIYATSCGFEMRRVFAPFAEHHRVYCPDLIGFGLSDHPVMDYTPETFMQLIHDFAQDVIGGPCVVVASSLVAAYAVQVAHDHPQLFTRLVLSVPTGIDQLADTTRSTVKEAVYALIKSPVIGEALFNALASKASIRYFLETQTYFDPAFITDELLEYYHTAAHQPNARYAPAAFVGQQLAWSIRHAFANLPQPVLIFWGANAGISPPRYAEGFRHTNPHARIEILDRCGSTPHEERAEDYVRITEEWLSLSDAAARIRTPAPEPRERD